jgi:hypothetical protein
VADVRCRAVQSDLTVFQADNGRRYLLQSIDRPVTAPDCSGVDTATTQEDERGTMRTRARFGYEGLRMFDVTDANNPRYVKFFRTECGSHTHTLVPDRRNGMVHAYNASYPLGSGITPEVDREAAGDLFCDAPHQKISIVDIPLDDPESGEVRTKALSSDSEPYDPDGPYNATGGPTGGPIGGQAAFIACHDHQAFLPRNIMIGSCAGDAQFWDISDRGNPTSADGEAHTHIKLEPEFDFIHNAVVTWDGRTVAISDESGGGGEARCDGPQSMRGFTYFYPAGQAGRRRAGAAGQVHDPAPAEPRDLRVPQRDHAADDGRPAPDGAGVLPGRDVVLRLHRPGDAREIGFADPETSIGLTDAWSSYWYNGAVYVNGGLNRRNTPGQPTATAAWRPTGSGRGRQQGRDPPLAVPQPADPGGVPGPRGARGLRRRLRGGRQLARRPRRGEGRDERPSPRPPSLRAAGGPSGPPAREVEQPAEDPAAVRAQPVVLVLRRDPRAQAAHRRRRLLENARSTYRSSV